MSRSRSSGIVSNTFCNDSFTLIVLTPLLRVGMSSTILTEQPVWQTKIEHSMSITLSGKAIKSKVRVDNQPHTCRTQKSCRIHARQKIPTQSPEDHRPDNGLEIVAGTAHHVDEARRGPGVAAADVDDGGPVGALAEIVAGTGNTHENTCLACGLCPRQAKHGHGGKRITAHGKHGPAQPLPAEPAHQCVAERSPHQARDAAEEKWQAGHEFRVAKLDFVYFL